MAEQIAGEYSVNINVVTDQSAKNLRDLNAEIKELQDGLEQVDFGGKDFDKSSKDLETATDRFTKMGGELTGAFGTAQQAAALFGQENSTVTRLLGDAKKASEAFAVAQKVQTVVTKGTTAATKGFRAALISTGIGALVVIIGELISNWDKWRGSIMKVVDVFIKLNPPLLAAKKVFMAIRAPLQKLAEDFNLVATEAEKANRAIVESAEENLSTAAKLADRRIALEKAKGNEVNDLIKEKLQEQVNLAHDAEQALLADSTKFTAEEKQQTFERLDEARHQLQVFLEQEETAKREAAEEAAEIAAEAAEEARKKREEDQAQQLEDEEAMQLRLLEMTVEQTKSQEDFEALQAELRERDLENFKGTAEQKLEFERLRKEQEKAANEKFKADQQALQDEKDKKDAALTAAQKQKDQEDLDRANQHALAIARIEAGLDGEITTEERIELERLQFRARKDALNEEDKANKELVEALEKEHQQKLNDIREEGDKASLEKAKTQRQIRLQIAQESLKAITSMGNALMALSQANDKEGEVSIRKQKKRARQKLLMDQANAIMGAVAGGMTQPFPANIFAVATGVAAVIANFANAKKVMSQIGQDVGGSDSASVSAGGGVGAGATIPSAPPSVTGSSGTEQTTEDVFGEGAMPRAFVVESDMTSAQEAAQKTNDLATL